MVYIAIAAFFYSLVQLFVAVATRNIDTNVVAGVSNLLSGLIPIFIAIPFLNKNLLGTPSSKLGIIMAVLAGIAIAIFSMAIAKSYSVNKVAIVAPLVFGGAIFLSAIWSFIFLKEKITLMEGVGLFVILIGLSILTYARLSGK